MTRHPSSLCQAKPGCTSCGSAATATVDGLCGRRCADCPPVLDPADLAQVPGEMGAYIRGRLPEGGYRRDLADHLVDLGRADAAFTYLGAWLAREAGQRFTFPAAGPGGAR